MYIGQGIRASRFIADILSSSFYIPLSHPTELCDTFVQILKLRLDNERIQFVEIMGFGIWNLFDPSVNDLKTLLTICRQCVRTNNELKGNRHPEDDSR